MLVAQPFGLATVGRIESARKPSSRRRSGDRLLQTAATARSAATDLTDRQHQPTRIIEHPRAGGTGHPSVSSRRQKGART